jgi:RimJ/RimL family protein N-acetyltransferase
MRTLVATRCSLEPQLAAHAKEMFAVLQDPALYEFENAPPRSEAWLAERFARLESRTSTDGTELWLNWVVRLPSGELIGYTQATVRRSGIASMAYEIASRYWRQGFGSSAVGAMLIELAAQYGVHTFLAVLKARNFRSVALLEHLGFVPATADQAEGAGAEPDELVMASGLRRSPGDPAQAVGISSTLTIQGTPNRSTSMPKPGDQKVAENGILTTPPAASA